MSDLRRGDTEDARDALRALLGAEPLRVVETGEGYRLADLTARLPLRGRWPHEGRDATILEQPIDTRAKPRRAPVKAETSPGSQAAR